ncbi:hypothetical protein A6A08_01725 [Nocardiopsis sp. TSRI0078]|nr:hypothetical protein A6A08_01725 [Nocardiopsis sp. TSRI0078]
MSGHRVTVGGHPARAPRGMSAIRRRSATASASSATRRHTSSIVFAGSTGPSRPRGPSCDSPDPDSIVTRQRPSASVTGDGRHAGSCPWTRTRKRVMGLVSEGDGM